MTGQHTSGTNLYGLRGAHGTSIIYPVRQMPILGPRQPTCIEIANDFELWGEYVDPDATTTNEWWENSSVDERLAIIHDLCPLDCNCGWIERQDG